jgi:hypothetical protein
VFTLQGLKAVIHSCCKDRSIINEQIKTNNKNIFIFFIKKEKKKKKPSSLSFPPPFFFSPFYE